MLSTPRYEEDVESSLQPKLPKQPKQSDKLLSPTRPVLSSNDVGALGGGLVPMSQYLEDSTNSTDFDDGFFAKVLWDRNDVLGPFFL